MRQALLLVALLVPAFGAGAQNVDDVLTFEVASIKVTTMKGGGPPPSPDRYNLFRASLRDLIRDAYHLQPFEIIGGPEWAAGAVRFDVMAKASFVPSRQQMLLMAQQLLRERFALRTHNETREMPIYELRLARDDGRLGSQLTRTAVDCAAVEADRKRTGETAPRVPLTAGDRPVCNAFQMAQPKPGGMTLRYRASGMTSEELAVWLTPYVARRVIDRTGLNGDFDLDLAFSLGGAQGPAAPVDETVSIFAALQEQLGLKLESTRGPVTVLVIDSAQMPTPD